MGDKSREQRTVVRNRDPFVPVREEPLRYYGICLRRVSKKYVSK